jgi:outer membrane protein, heavy metal efflux system
MMMLRRAFVPSVVVAAGLLPAVTFASPPDPPSLTLRQAKDEAARANPDLDALRRMSEAAARRPDAERYLMPPMVEAQAFEWPIDTLDPRRVQFMVGVAQELPGRGKRAARAEVLERRAAVVANEVPMRARHVASDAAVAYADLALARRTLEVIDEGVALVRQVADAAEARYTAGRTPQQDVLKAIVERSRLEEQRLMAVEQARMAEARLNTLMGRRPDAPIGALDPADEGRPLPAYSQLGVLANAPHPEVQGTVLERDAATSAIAVIDAERRPDFVVRGGYMVMPDMRDRWTATVGITWPNAPWARKRLDAMAREAAADVEAAEARQRAVESRLQLMAREAWVRADAASARARLLATSILPQTRHTFDLLRAAYQNDRADFLDVLDIQRQLLDASLEYWRAIADRDRAVAELERATDLDLSAPRPMAVESGVLVLNCEASADARCR